MTGGPVLVIGGSGFLGSAICQALDETGREYVSTGRSRHPSLDILEPGSIASVLDEHRPGSIVCAAGIASASAANSDPSGCFRANVAGVYNLVQAIRDSGSAAHLTLISTAAVYAPSERRLNEKSPTSPSSIYSASKLAAEKICDWHAAEGGSVAVLRCFNLIGPRQSAEQVPGEFAFASTTAQRQGKDKVAVRVRDPRIRRDFTDVRDAGRAVAEVSARRIEGTFNLCSGRAVSLEELAELFGNLELDASLAPRTVDPETIEGDPGRLRDTAGWVATTSLEASVAALLAGS